MDGIAFENLIAAKMRAFGWESTCTPGSSDYGADVICTLGAQKLIIQCKCYGDLSYVGADAIRQAYGAVAHYKAAHGLVVYRGRPTSQARNLAKSTGVHLFHFDDLQPGWWFDRTREGLEARRRKEAEAEQEREHQERAAEEAYRTNLKMNESELRKWRALQKRHETFKPVGIVSLLISAALFVDGTTAVAVGAMLFAAWAYWGTAPGPQPSLPVKPAHLKGTSEKAANRITAVSRNDRAFADDVSALNTAKYLRLLGYQIDRGERCWLVTDKNGKATRLSNGQLVEFARGSPPPLEDFESALTRALDPDSRHA